MFIILILTAIIMGASILAVFCYLMEEDFLGVMSIAIIIATVTLLVNLAGT